MMKVGPDPKVTGSRFALLNEGTEPIVIEEAALDKDLTLKEIKEMNNGGSSQSNLGPRGKRIAKKVRNVKGGKNPQNENKGKENKLSTKSLGPRPKQFAQKIVKVPLGIVSEKSRGKGTSRIGTSSLREKGRSGSKLETMQVDATSRPNFDFVNSAGKQGMDWKGGDTCDDAEVLRELHVGILSSCHSSRIGGRGLSLDQSKSQNDDEDEADQVRLLLAKGRQEINGEGGQGASLAQINSPC